MNADDAGLFSMVTMEVDGHTRNANLMSRSKSVSSAACQLSALSNSHAKRWEDAFANASTLGGRKIMF